MFGRTRSQEAKRIEESICLPRENSKKKKKHAMASEGLKELITRINIKYDQLVSKMTGTTSEIIGYHLRMIEA